MVQYRVNIADAFKVPNCTLAIFKAQNLCITNSKSSSEHEACDNSKIIGFRIRKVRVIDPYDDDVRKSTEDNVKEWIDLKEK